MYLTQNNKLLQVSLGGLLTYTKIVQIDLATRVCV